MEWRQPTRGGECTRYEWQAGVMWELQDEEEEEDKDEVKEEEE